MQSIKFEFTDKTGTEYSVVFTIKDSGEPATMQTAIQHQPSDNQEEEKIPIDKQYENFFSFNGTPQTGKDVNADEN